MKHQIETSKGTRSANGHSRPAATTHALLNGTNHPNGAAAKWAWHYRVLISLHDRLVADQGERRRYATQPVEPHSLDGAETASDAFDHDLALGQLSAQQHVIYEVEEAINRIRAGTYGICEATGEPIPAARLRAIPWTRFARDAELRLEKHHAVGKPALGALGSVRGKLAKDVEEDESEAEAEDESLRKIFKPGSNSDSAERELLAKKWIKRKIL
jgi:RNA polymerase-binding transcription factor DksA